MMRTKFFALLCVGAFSTLGCDPGGDDDSDSGPATTIAATGDDDGDDDGEGTAADTAGDADDTAGDAEEDADDEAEDEAEDDSPGGCDPECPAGEECIAGTCFPSGDDNMDADAGMTDDGPVGGEDPNYPNPANGCTAPAIDGNMAVNPGINACLQPCDPMAADVFAACPQPMSGMAPAVCVVGDGMGSGADCMMNGAACETDGEWCLADMMMNNSCQTAFICVVSCAGGGACPDGMSCTNGACGY